LPTPASASTTGPAIDHTRKAQLAGLVFERTGVPIDAADPAFALVELNRLVLQEAADEMIRRIAHETDGLPDRLSALTAVATRRMVQHSLERIAEELQVARREIEEDVSRERDSLRHYGDVSRAAQQELSVRLARSSKTVIVASSALAALVVVLAIAAGAVLFAAQQHQTDPGSTAPATIGR